MNVWASVYFYLKGILIGRKNNKKNFILMACFFLFCVSQKKFEYFNMLNYCVCVKALFCCRPNVCLYMQSFDRQFLKKNSLKKFQKKIEFQIFLNYFIGSDSRSIGACFILNLNYRGIFSSFNKLLYLMYYKDFQSKTYVCSNSWF